MKIYLLSLGAGLLVGVVYSLLQVRSPAPPQVALIGLLGILVGEQLVPVGKAYFGFTDATAVLKRDWFLVLCCGVIGGGYSTDVAALAARHAILFEAASSHA